MDLPGGALAYRKPTSRPARASSGHARATPRPALGAIPTTYQGVLMRSRLEARWAQRLDSLGLHWEYEPSVLRLGRGRAGLYLPDFWLPEQRAWIEVKGPHWERFDKTRALARSLGAPGLVLVATANGVCWRVPYQGLPSQEEARTGTCPSCRRRTVGIPSRGALACRAGCPGTVKAGEVLGW